MDPELGAEDLVSFQPLISLAPVAHDKFARPGYSKRLAISLARNSMTLPFVCASCRRRLLSQAAPHDPQWLRRASHSRPAKQAIQRHHRGHQGYGSRSPGSGQGISPIIRDEQLVEQPFQAHWQHPSLLSLESTRIYSKRRSPNGSSQDDGLKAASSGIDGQVASRDVPVQNLDRELPPSPSTSPRWGALRRARDGTAPSKSAPNTDPASFERRDTSAVYRSNSRTIQAWRTDAIPHRRNQSIATSDQAQAPIDEELADLMLPFQHITRPSPPQPPEAQLPKGPSLLPVHPLNKLLRLDVSPHIQDIPLFKYEDELGIQDACVVLIERVVPTWCESLGTASGVPRPTLLHERMVNMNLKSTGGVEIWSAFMWTLLRELSKRMALRDAVGSRSHEKTILMELMKMWDRFLVRHRYGHMPRTVVPTWPALSHSKRMTEIKEWFSKDFSTRWGHLFPRFRAGETEGTDTAALLSLALLRDYKETGIGIQQAVGFQLCISRLMVNSTLVQDLEKHKAVAAERLRDDELVNSLSPRLEWAFLNAVTISEESHEKRLAITGSVSDGVQSRAGTSDIVDSFKKRVSRAIADGNPGRVESLLDEAHSSFSRGQQPVGNLPAALYAHFIFAFAALRRPQRAMEVLNGMVLSGLAPNLSTWDSMIRGSGLARDHEAVHETWHKMMRSGVQADAHIWATRIHALGVSGHWQSAMAAFQDMTSQWISAARAGGASGQVWELPDVADAPKPTARCLNSLVAGLARGLKYEQLGEVLRWAKNLGIKPDAYTFNPLFKVAALRQDGTLTENLLKQMQALDIQPDIATFTMMLDSIFQSDSRPAEGADATALDEKQQASLADLFQTMHAAGVSATAHTFATLVNGLLKSPQPNEEAAYSIVKYLKANGMPLSSAVYTALITHHFESASPDLGAVEKLWHEARAVRSVSLDVVFYDRLIEGFARANQVGKAMTALTQAGKRGKVPGWIAMTEVISALLRAGERDRAQRLVMMVKAEEESSRDTIRARIGQASFWNMVREGGLQGAPASETP